MSPANATLAGGQTQQFAATVTGSTNTTVTWSLSPSLGAIIQTGLYTAPSAIANAQAVTVIATSQADPTKSATATVTLYSAATSGSYFPVLGTFLNFYRDFTPELWGMEFDYMRQVDIDTIVVVAVGHLRSAASDPFGI